MIRVTSALAVVLAGCAISPSQMASMPNSQLCYYSITGGPQTSANARYVLSQRGYSCDQRDIQNSLAAQQAEIARQQANDAALLNAATLMRQRQQTALPPAPTQGARFYKGERIDGMNKICFYDGASGAVAITVSASQLCPM